MAADHDDISTFEAVEQVIKFESEDHKADAFSNNEMLAIPVSNLFVND